MLYSLRENSSSTNVVQLGFNDITALSIFINYDDMQKYDVYCEIKSTVVQYVPKAKADRSVFLKWKRYTKL